MPKAAEVKSPVAVAKPAVATTKPSVPKKPAAPKAATPAKAAATGKKPAVKKPVAKKPAAKPVASKPGKSAAPVAETGAPKEKAKKAKLVRDSFSMPEAEYAVLGAVKKACLKAGVEVKKSELLRIGVALIQKMDVAALKGVLSTLPPLKAGRPKQDK